MGDDYLIAVVIGGWVLIFFLKWLNSHVQRKREAVNPTFSAEEERFHAVIEQTDAFMVASMLMVGHATINRTQTQKLGACMYLVGATDALSQHHRLSDHDFLIAACVSLRNFGLSKSDAEGFYSTIPRMSVDPFGRRAMIEGGKAVRAWLSGADPNAPIRLFELVREWEANPEHSF